MNSNSCAVAYLDEVQDFSYAAIFLICGIAGKTERQWVAAGDTAQMISPGCSFEFNGLKQTLLKIRDGVKLGKVVQLKRNYRMSKGVLEVGNAVLLALKKKFPDQIEYAKPEVAMKDLGFRVAIIDWKDAFEKTEPRLGLKQAIIYSGSSKDISESKLVEKISTWTRSHPIILPVLDSKGLEWDDVLVIFNKDRKAWNIESEVSY